MTPTYEELRQMVLVLVICLYVVAVLAWDRTPPAQINCSVCGRTTRDNHRH